MSRNVPRAFLWLMCFGSFLLFFALGFGASLADEDGRPSLPLRLLQLGFLLSFVLTVGFLQVLGALDRLDRSAPVEPSARRPGRRED